MSELLELKKQALSEWSTEELKAMTIFQFNEYVSDLSRKEARALLYHFFLQMIKITGKLPNIDSGDSVIDSIDCDFNVLEVTLDRLFEDDLPEYEKSHPEMPLELRRELRAATDIYLDYSSRIRGSIDEWRNL